MFLLRRFWPVILGLLAGVGLGAVGVLVGLGLPAERVEERTVTAARLSVRAGWEWAVEYPGGNAVWSPGTVLPSGRAFYPLAGGARLKASPVVELSGAEGVGAAARISGLLKATAGDNSVWEKPLFPETGIDLAAPAVFRGEAVRLDLPGLRQEWEATGKALGLLERYEARLELSLTVELPELGRRIGVAGGGLLFPDTFAPGPPENWAREESIPLRRTVTERVPVSVADRARAGLPWLAGGGACLIVGLWLGWLRGRGGDPEFRRYRRWVVRGRPAGPTDGQVVELEDLGSLVRVANDLGRRVIYDPKKGYAVQDGSVWYFYRPSRLPRVGELLVRQGVVTEKEVREAVRRQQTWRRSIGEVLLAEGLVDPVALYAALAFQRGLVYVEPDPGAAALDGRFLFDAFILGERPDGLLAVAVSDPTAPAAFVEGVVGRPVWPAITRPRPQGLPPCPPEAPQSLRLDVKAAEALRGRGLSLGVLLYVCGAVGPEALQRPNLELYRELTRQGGVHPDLLQLAVALVGCYAEAGRVPTLPELLRRAQRVPENVPLTELAEEQLVRWYYLGEKTLGRAKRLLAAAGECHAFRLLHTERQSSAGRH